MAPAEPAARVSRAPIALLPDRPEGVREHVVGHLPAVRDARGLVEAPVDAEIDPALAVLLFGRGERRERAWRVRAYVAVVVSRDAVELVRDERERNRVGAIDVA